MVTVLLQLGAIGLGGASAWDMEEEAEELATEGKTVTVTKTSSQGPIRLTG